MKISEHTFIRIAVHPTETPGAATFRAEVRVRGFEDRTTYGVEGEDAFTNGVALALRNLANAIEIAHSGNVPDRMIIEIRRDRSGIAPPEEHCKCPPGWRPISEGPVPPVHHPSCPVRACKCPPDWSASPHVPTVLHHPSCPKHDPAACTCPPWDGGRHERPVYAHVTGNDGKSGGCPSWQPPPEGGGG